MKYLRGRLCPKLLNRSYLHAGNRGGTPPIGIDQATPWLESGREKRTSRYHHLCACFLPSCYSQRSRALSHKPRRSPSKSKSSSSTCSKPAPTPATRPVSTSTGSSASTSTPSCPSRRATTTSASTKTESSASSPESAPL